MSCWLLHSIVKLPRKGTAIFRTGNWYHEIHEGLKSFNFPHPSTPSFKITLHPSRGQCSEKDRTHNKGDRAQKSGGNVDFVLLYHLELVCISIFHFFNFPCFYNVISDLCAFLYPLKICICILTHMFIPYVWHLHFLQFFDSYIFFSFYLFHQIEGGDRKACGRWTSCCFISHFHIP